MGKLKELDYIDYPEELPQNGTPWDPNENTGTQIMAIGASQRTTITKSPLARGWPNGKDGVRKALFTGVNERGEVEIFEVESSNELANLPTNAINIHAYLNLLREENAEVAVELSEILQDLEHHTAHHTAGADKHERLKKALQLSQLNRFVHQDKKIGTGITIPEPMRRAVSPDSLTGPDGVTWE
jgi:hypothetical protein